MTILGSPKTKEMLESFYGITENVRAVQDGETLSLGKSELKFFHTPFVHWPETMMTYDVTRRVLFSCDGFGGYGALSGSIFDDQCQDIAFYETEALRYYTNVVAKFSKMVLRAIDKLAPLPVDIVAPSHGLIWRKNPSRIVELYKRWAEYAESGAEPGVTLIYGSMYGYTEMMMNAVASGIARAGVPLEIFDAGRTHASYILSSLWTRKGVVIGAPTYEGRLFPPVMQVLEMAALKGAKNKKYARFGSYGWAGGAQRDSEQMLAPLHWELVEALEFCGRPGEEELKKGVEFGARFAQAVKRG
jgi:flavorubredoxin